jgi:hypothetical protein
MGTLLLFLLRTINLFPARITDKMPPIFYPFKHSPNFYFIFPQVFGCF